MALWCSSLQAKHRYDPTGKKHMDPENHWCVVENCLSRVPFAGPMLVFGSVNQDIVIKTKPPESLGRRCCSDQGSGKDRHGHEKGPHKTQPTTQPFVLCIGASCIMLGCSSHPCTGRHPAHPSDTTKLWNLHSKEEQ